MYVEDYVKGVPIPPYDNVPDWYQPNINYAEEALFLNLGVGALFIVLGIMAVIYIHDRGGNLLLALATGYLIALLGVYRLIVSHFYAVLAGHGVGGFQETLASMFFLGQIFIAQLFIVGGLGFGWARRQYLKRKGKKNGLLAAEALDRKEGHEHRYPEETNAKKEAG